MVAVDENVLSLIFHPKARPPDDPTTGQPIEYLEDRIGLLINNLQRANETILIPTPVLTEFLHLLYLVGDDPADYLSEINSISFYKFGDFNQRAAIELAEMHRRFAETRSGRALKRESGKEETKAKVNFDRQIVAICKVNRVTTIYSDDKGLRTFAMRNDIDVIRTWELPLPKTGRQRTFEELEHERTQPSPRSTVMPTFDSSEDDR
jgi:predicted nucleic acid-binding protein